MPPLRQTKLLFKPLAAASSPYSSSTKKPAEKAPIAENKATRDDKEEQAVTQNGAKESVEASGLAINTLSIAEKIGPIFEAPDNTVIIHACNCLGSWSAGIAAAFLQRYPRAFKVYQSHCANNTPESLVGTALLIPPMEITGPRHFVGCLFTSRKFGRGKDTPEQILKNTAPAMGILIKAMADSGREGSAVEEIRMCQINSGLFSVPWEKSRTVIETLGIVDTDYQNIPKEIIVYSMPPRK